MFIEKTESYTFINDSSLDKFGDYLPFLFRNRLRIIFWRYESAKDQATMEAVIATARNVSVCILPTIVGIIGMFEIGGEIMIRFTRLMQEAKAEGKAEGKVEGKAEGKAEVYRAWHADWERRRQTAAEKGIPFDEPPPPKPEDITEN